MKRIPMILVFAALTAVLSLTACGGDDGPNPDPPDCEGNCNVPPPAEICDDDVDNDGDGATDCDDSDCSQDMACQTSSVCAPYMDRYREIEGDTLICNNDIACTFAEPRPKVDDPALCIMKCMVSMTEGAFSCVMSTVNIDTSANELTCTSTSGTPITCSM